MRIPKFLSVIGIAGLLVLVTIYEFRFGGGNTEPVASAREKEMKQEIDHLHKTNDNLLANLNRAHLSRDQPAIVSFTTSPKSSMTSTTVTSHPVSSSVAQGESLPADAEPLIERKIIIMISFPTKKQMDAVKSTSEQSAFFENMKQRLDNPSVVKTLNFSELIKMEEMKTLPDPLRQTLLAKAVEKYNHGEVDEKTFLSGTEGYSP